MLRKTLANPKLLEVIGLIMVLAATAWQLFAQSASDSMADSANDYARDKKLDAIWLILTDHYTHSQPLDKAGFYSDANLKALMEGWEYAGAGMDDRIQTQAKIARWITGGGFVLGGALLAIAKFMEMRKPELAEQVVDASDGEGAPS